MSSRVEKKASARERAARLRAEQQRADRRRRVFLASGAVLAVVVVLGGLVAIKLSGLGSSTSTGRSGQADAALLAALSVPPGTLDAVGTGTAQGGPKKIDAPALARDGKPRVLYIGAEYCPYCAAERWPVAVALSRFGTFSQLGTTHSSGDDVFPNTPTLSFHDSAYTSKYVDFTGVETTTNKRTATGYQKLDEPSAADQKIFDTYNQPPYVSGQGGAIPFVDLGGTFVSSGATYGPQLLQGKTHAEIAKALQDPKDPISKAVNGSANLFTAAICQATDNQPSNVCSSSGVRAAAAKLGRG